MKSPALKAVVFDWGGTLTPHHTFNQREQWDVFAAGYGAMACAQRDLAARIVAAEDKAWQRSRNDHVSSRLDEMLAAAGVTPGPACDAGLAAYRDWWVAHTITHPDVEPLFVALRERGLKIGVLSNTMWDSDYHRSLFERDGVLHLIDADLYSSQTPWTKPSPKIFTEIARKLDVHPEECCFVGDRHYEDVWGPQQVGMRTAFVPHSTFDPSELVDVAAQPDVVVDSLLDLLPFIDATR